MTTANNLASLGSVAVAPEGTAPAYACRAWVNFNGTGTVAIRASGNVSSITDNGTGDYTVNFTTAMPDVNYCVTASNNNFGGGDNWQMAIRGSNSSTEDAPTLMSTSQVRMSVTRTTAFADINVGTVAIFR